MYFWEKWGDWFGPFSSSPVELDKVLMPNNPASYIQIKFNFSTMDKAATPRLKSFTAYYECNNIPG